MSSDRPLQFGIYPLMVAGTPAGLATGPPDDYDQVRRALDGLGNRVLPRTYLVDIEPGGEQSMLALGDRYCAAGLLGHVTVGCLRDTGFDLDRWRHLVRTIVRRYSPHLRSLQITNEPNLTFMDGSKPYVLDALIHGVVAAKDEARELGVRLDVGFGSVPQSPVALPTFWNDIARVGGSAFLDAIDFVGHNFYIDVFEDPLDVNEIPGRVEAILRDLRTRDLATANIPATVPIRVTENGWPTGINPLTNTPRTYRRQSEVIEATIRTIHRLGHELNISHYMLFGLRDADSSKPDLFHQFGILCDDYSPKPAYTTYKGLIDELAS